MDFVELVENLYDEICMMKKICINLYDGFCRKSPICQVSPALGRIGTGGGESWHTHTHKRKFVTIRLFENLKICHVEV